MDSKGPCQVTITAPDRSWLAAFARQLVADWLAAAAHLDTMATTYRWQGVVHEAEEARAVLHTSFECVSVIAERVRQEHPYEVACVAAVPIVAGEPEYLAWISEQAAGWK
jgi:periplasmic divalent cation tolerance protein